ncbi:gamma-glutamyltranspeptidase 1 [Fopius arisanus]|uniref:Gamma-glutamyltranspeptidase 1 n=1 Tax=Fopius arisanus TaxID=64838 RepID=A0A9R1U9N8_9HYME|nr:PREDICTED: gamma-glutamyltranspeptidase 1-like [Fopius arisanus]
MFGFKKRTIIGLIVGLCIVVGIIIAVVILTRKGDKHDWENKFVSESILGEYQRAAVVTNGLECSEIGVEFLKKNGSAMDAAIAALLCEGVTSSHSMGIGGGFLMTIWDAEKNESVFLDARETAPAAAHENMFKGNASLSFFGGLAIAVPGELAGYWEAHQKYGKLPWKDLFEPTIALCSEGVVINEYLASHLKSKEHLILEQPSLAEILINPKTGRTWTVGDRFYRPKLNTTLKLIAEQGPSIFYNGSIGEQIIKDIEDFGGIMTMDDLRNYEPKWKTPTRATIGDMTILSAPPPGSGLILSFILNVLEGLVPTPSEGDFWQRIVEAFKWGYARRTQLGDDAFEDLSEIKANLSSKRYIEEIRSKIKDDWTSTHPKYYGVDVAVPNDSGTSHVSVLAPDGSAVSVTSTINQVFGAMRRSVSTGIIFNDEMDDFSTPGMSNGFGLPPSPKNFIKPGKRPMSSMVPTIVINSKNEVQMVIGAAGGSKIPSAVALSMILNLWTGYNVKEAVDAQRLHHQVLPMRIDVEKGFSQPLLRHMIEIGHNTSYFRGIGSAVCAISKINAKGISANSDYRRQGGVAGY